jgi:hypothetical protein
MIVWIISISLASVQLFVARMQLIEDEEEMFTDNNINNTKTFNKIVSFSYQNSTQFYSRQALTMQEKIYTCNEVWETNLKQQIYTLFNFFAVYLIPVFFLGRFIKRDTLAPSRNSIFKYNLPNYKPINYF